MVSVRRRYPRRAHLGALDRAPPTLGCVHAEGGVSAFAPAREANYRAEAIRLYQELCVDLMLCRIVAIGADPVFCRFVDELAAHLGTDPEYAAMQLWPTTRRIYLAAKEAADE
jgi:hypothetical protein